MDRLADDPALELLEQALLAHDERIEIVRVLCDALITIFGHQNRIRMAETADLREIQRGFDADDHVFGQHILTAGAQPGLLVVAQADAVSGAVDDPVAVPLRPEKLLRGNVDVAAANAGFDHSISDGPGLHDDIVEPALFCRRVAEEHRALDLGGVAVNAVVTHQNDRPGAHAHVHVGQAVGLSALRRGPAGGDETAIEIVELTGRDDAGLEGLGRHGRLDHGLTAVQSVVNQVHALVRPRRRVPDGRDLIRGLDPAHFGDKGRDDCLLHLQQRDFRHRKLRLDGNHGLPAEQSVQFVVPVLAFDGRVLKIRSNLPEPLDFAHVVVFKLRHHQLGNALRVNHNEKGTLHRHIGCAGKVVDGILSGDNERVQVVGLHERLQFQNSGFVIVLDRLRHWGFHDLLLLQ